MILLALATLIPGCANVLTLDASEEFEKEFLPYISALDERACEGAEVTIETQASKYLVRVRRDGQNAEALVTKKEDGFAMAAAFLSVPRLANKAEAPPIEVVSPEASEGPVVPPQTNRSLLAFSFMGGPNAATPNRIFGGVDLEVASAITSYAFVSLRGGLMLDPKDFLLPIRFNAGARFFDGKVLAGLGGGARIKFEGRQRVAPMVEAMVRAQYPMSKNFAVFTELNGAYVFNERNNFENVNAGLRIGVTWEFFHR